MATTQRETAVRKDWLSLAAYGGIFVFGIVMALLGAILPVLAEQVRFDLGQAGNLFLLMNFCMLVSMPGLGPLMDRFGKKPPLVTGLLLVALALLLIAGASGYGALLASVVLLGAGGGAVNGAANLLVADLHTEPRRKAAALNLLGIFFGFGALFLPFTIGLLLQALGLTRILYLAMGLSLALALVILRLPFPAPRHGEGFQIAAAARLVKHPLVLLLGFMLFFQSGNEFIIGGYTSTYLTRELGSPVTEASYLLAVYWGAVMLGRVISSRLLLKVSGSTLVLLSALGAAAGAGLLLVATGQGLAALAITLIGLSFASIFPTTLARAGSDFEAYSGTVFGILFAIALTGGMTLPWAVGQLAEVYGLRPALLLAVANAGLIALLQLFISRYRSDA